MSWWLSEAELDNRGQKEGDVQASPFRFEEESKEPICQHSRGPSAVGGSASANFDARPSVRKD